MVRGKGHRSRRPLRVHFFAVDCRGSGPPRTRLDSRDRRPLWGPAARASRRSRGPLKCFDQGANIALVVVNVGRHAQRTAPQRHEDLPRAADSSRHSSDTELHLEGRTHPVGTGADPFSSAVPFQPVKIAITAAMVIGISKTHPALPAQDSLRPILAAPRPTSSHAHRPKRSRKLRNRST